uniref:Uncharacterized protein n=1 Tax=Peronospora matthiolae TaxID=2874970 RepID=A0AAV1VPA2_9STRA
MRNFNTGGVCTYGLNTQAGHMFERSQSDLRQRRFGQARGIASAGAVKRPRDQDKDSDDLVQHRPERRAVLVDGLKRMRVSSPVESPLTSDVDSDMTDEEAATPRSTWHANKALVPVAALGGKNSQRPLQYALSAAVEQQPWHVKELMTTERAMGRTWHDGPCRALVVFNPYQSPALAGSASRVELVEDDERAGDVDSTSESGDEHVVRFEELSSDNDEPVDMDIDD